jgi:hypothetical protein
MMSDSLGPSPMTASGAAGRSCPLHYRYAPSSLARSSDAECDVLYVVGGLYGNEPALDAVLALFRREQGSKRLVFNGDFNWFDIAPDVFGRINERVLAFDALRGNVETELVAPSHDPEGAGCGCAYPDWVDEQVVEKSNRIIQRLRATAKENSPLSRRLAALPMTMRVNVGDCRVAIVHGDAESLAGWGFAQEHLRDPAHRKAVRHWFDVAQVDAFACSHTCLPVFHSLPMPGRRFTPVVLNNGAAGMPNFRDRTAGLLTRVALRPFEGPERVLGLVRHGVCMDAIEIRYDERRWAEQFLRQWPERSDAHTSYWRRIAAGPVYDTTQVLITSED